MTAPFQSSIGFTLGFGVPGEIIYDGPVRSAPWQLISNPNLNTVGSTAYTVVSGATGINGSNSGVAMAGGTGQFAGVLANPKNYTRGLIGSASLVIPDDTVAELVTMAQMLAYSTTANNPGDSVVFAQATGIISTIAAGTAIGTGYTQFGTTILRPGSAGGLAMVQLDGFVLVGGGVLAMGE